MCPSAFVSLVSYVPRGPVTDVVASLRPRPSLKAGETHTHMGFSRLPTGRGGPRGLSRGGAELEALGSGTKARPSRSRADCSWGACAPCAQQPGASCQELISRCSGSELVYTECHCQAACSALKRSAGPLHLVSGAHAPDPGSRLQKQEYRECTPGSCVITLALGSDHAAPIGGVGKGRWESGHWAGELQAGRTVSCCRGWECEWCRLHSVNGREA